MRQTARVLVVDDETRFRENMLKVLSAAGHHAKGAENGARALEILEEEQFDIVLLDLSMPELTGELTMQSMRLKGIDAKVIILTGHASIDKANDMLALGAFDFLLKPISSSVLLKRIAFAMEQREVDALDLSWLSDPMSPEPHR